MPAYFFAVARFRSLRLIQAVLAIKGADYTLAREICNAGCRFYPRAPARLFCLTSALVERRPAGPTEVRFCLRLWVRLRLSCSTFTRSTTFVGAGGAEGFAAISLCCAFCSMISIKADR